MAQAILILQHAFKMIFHNPGATLRAILPGLAFVLAAAFGLLLIAPDIVQALIENDEPQFSVQAAGQMLLGMAVLFVGFVIMVIIWHRFVLLSGPERDAGLMPSAPIVFGYIWKSLLLGLVMIGIGIITFIPVGLFIAAMSAYGDAAVISGLASFAATLLISWAAMRLSLILPAVAIGKDLSFGESWSVTRPASATVFILTIFLSVLNLCVTQVLGWVVTDSLVVSGLAQLISTVILTLVSASVLTTLYGLLIERRSLGAH